jgi:prepilin-type N-terminal cleavage/methylation domain-containing protein
MTHRRSRVASGFSLVEILVVVAIITILMTMAGVGYNHIVNSNRVTDTRAIMLTLEGAIKEFAAAQPIERRDIDVGFPYGMWFGHWPPSPVTPWDTTAPLAVGAVPADYETTAAGAAAAFTRFDYLIRRYFWPPPGSGPAIDPPVGVPPAGIPAEKHYASIECLVLFLTQCSPQAKAMIDKIPDERRPNLDHDRAMLVDSSGTQTWVDLHEVVDSWGVPLRWTVMPADQSIPQNSGVPVRWELRSAGKDGVFSPPFTLPGASDDVVVTSR